MRRLALMTFALLLAGPTADAEEDPVREAYVAAMQAREAEDYPTYRAQIERALEHAPSHPILHQHMARALAQLGRPSAARSWIESALALGARFDVEEDPWLEPLRSVEEWKTIVEQARRARAHRGPGRVGLRVDDWDLLPEGIAHDPQRGHFYLSSVSGRRIVRVDASGKAEDFIATEEEGFPSGLGLEVDTRRGWLWACGTADSSLFPHGEGLRTGLWAFRLEDASLAGRWWAPERDAPHNFNDLEVLDSGIVCVTDARAGTVYTLDVEEDSLATLVEPGSLVGPNGITDDGELLFVAEYSEGVRVLDPRTGEGWDLESGPDLTLIGIDGLYFHDDSLVAIQNAMGLDRVIRLELDEARRAVVAHEVLEARHPRMDDPTTGVIVGDELWYIANSHIATYAREGGWPEEPAEYGDVLVLRVGL